ncbi:tRNA (adenosine(37)-N6)-threonylcarbamoyltransferase complex ATPase subunit type 1 TsaE [Marinicella sp. W31]|uniref:tRNA (adenosine(37)-N6)-threonylcarbamoyltransferase complex ATPase subunit type 1 TsaE n=1 Tax=Marinicella sp. W31 TaxID=3023713 RepID=UPI003757F6AE
MTTHTIDSLKDLTDIATHFLSQLKTGDVVYLQGDLGTGKTTFTQLLLAAAGYQGHVKSPTYTLYEYYTTEQHSFYHMDLYRLSDPEELYFLGIDEILNGQHIVLIEWPQKGKGILPAATHLLEFSFQNQHRFLTIT